VSRGVRCERQRELSTSASKAGRAAPAAPNGGRVDEETFDCDCDCADADADAVQHRRTHHWAVGVPKKNKFRLQIKEGKGLPSATSISALCPGRKDRYRYRYRYRYFLLGWVAILVPKPSNHYLGVFD
jgi:hypothetical protein